MPHSRKNRIQGLADSTALVLLGRLGAAISLPLLVWLFTTVLGTMDRTTRVETQLEGVEDKIDTQRQWLVGISNKLDRLIERELTDARRTITRPSNSTDPGLYGGRLGTPPELRIRGDAPPRDRGG
jgi:hypothetical protein